MRRDVGYRVIAGGLHPDHATIARFRARHEEALGGKWLLSCAAHNLRKLHRHRTAG